MAVPSTIQGVWPLYRWRDYDWLRRLPKGHAMRYIFVNKRNLISFAEQTYPSVRHGFPLLLTWVLRRFSGM